MGYLARHLNCDSWHPIKEMQYIILAMKVGINSIKDLLEKNSFSLKAVINNN